MLPAMVYAGTYYEHPAGSYHGECIAWDGSYYSFTHTIELSPSSGSIAGSSERLRRFVREYTLQPSTPCATRGCWRW